MMQPELFERLQELAQTPRLLVASDYDGTLAEIVLTPAFAFPTTAAIRALRAAGELAATTTAIVSGRSLKDLSGFLGAERPHYLVGSHGAEWQSEGVVLATEQQDRLTDVATIISSIVNQGHGLSRELKPAGVALHFRGVAPSVAEAALVAAIERCGRVPGVNVRHGSEVVEFMVVEVNKADAVRRLRRTTGATGVIFVGDDLTDEDAFRTLSTGDLGIKVGPGETGAHFRVGSVPAVAAVLDAIGSLRREWAQRHLLPTGGHGLP